MTVWQDLEQEIRGFTEQIRSIPVLRTSHPRVVRDAVSARFDLSSPVPLPELTSAVAELLRTHTIHVTHPRYFGLFNPTVSEAGIVADALAALYNPQLAAWSHSPAANELERFILRYLGAALGFDRDATFANFTTGGAEANLSAVLAALAHRFPEVDREGVASVAQRLVMYVTGESHHSFVKIARTTGLGTRVLAEVPVTPQFAFDPQALAHRIHADRNAGLEPFMIIGTAGTTAGGTIDPLEALADLAAECGAWFHVDAAWGGGAALVPRLRAALQGIERADSVTWDAHKWLSVPMGAGMFFCRHVDAVRRAFAVSTSYMPAGGEETVDPYVTTVQWSRRAIGLKVFMSIAELGHTKFAERLDQQALMGDHLRARLQAAGWLIVNDTVLPLVCFTHPDIQDGRLTTTELLRRIYARGNVWISETVLGARERVLRACITSFRTEEQDLEYLVRELEHARVASE